MRKSAFFVVLLVATILSALSLRRTGAEVVPHHGAEVEAEGRANDCITCHDGLAAKNAGFCTVQCDFRGPHSILKRYPPSGKEKSFAPLEDLISKGVKLEQGRITCISCHNLRNPDRFHLWTDKTGDSLCLTCHVSQGR